jgi:hypothetical protein
VGHALSGGGLVPPSSTLLLPGKEGNTFVSPYALATVSPQVKTDSSKL